MNRLFSSHFLGQARTASVWGLLRISTRPTRDGHIARDRRSRAEGECPYDGLRSVGDYEPSPFVCMGFTDSLANVDLAVE